ncbi:hypothetical protein [Patulibacter sp.]|uniref:hypothetical protein n=1 Tax=Patulibacter sp. TaxID=1912859 RepID=UPI0027193158|nr:hypothetical protein [Patulibacter sp.]MDO9410496.1 hypothetical protein [Patulibacter sp.]
MPDDRRALWRRLQRGWPAAYPLVQFPNAPLLVAVAGSLAARALSGDASAVATAVSRMGVVVWAWLELTAGDNAVRRVLGAAGLAYMALQISGVGD